MRIKFLQSIAGARFQHKPGDEVDYPDNAEAQRFVDAGIAVKLPVVTVADGRRGQERAVVAPASRPGVRPVPPRTVVPAPKPPAPAKPAAPAKPGAQGAGAKGAAATPPKNADSSTTGG